MSDQLGTHLQDHLAGAGHAIELVETMRNEYSGEPLGEFVAAILVEIEADREVLRGLAERWGVGTSGLKELTAWLSEKMSRLKLGRGAGKGLGTLEALEFLELARSRVSTSPGALRTKRS